MKSLTSSFGRFRPSLPIAGLVLGISVVLIGAVLLLHYCADIPIGRLTRDPNTIGGSPLYAGFLSQIGILCWSAAAAVCLFGAKAISKHRGDQKLKTFLVVFGVVTLVLCLDDAFLIHEGFFPHFGIPEVAIYVAYGICALVCFLMFSSVILRTEYILMVIALVFFVVSIALDVFDPPGIDRYLFEDGAKLVGIISWLAYSFRVAASAASRRL